MADALATYLQELREIRSSGAAVKETSYYGPLANLLNAVGKAIKPRVRCIVNIRNRGAGIPDGGLFTPDQFQRSGGGEPLPGQVPSRGVIEVKRTDFDIERLAETEQVARYWERYGVVLATNYRDFVLIGRDADGKRTRLEAYRLAPNEAAFWKAAATPRETAGEQGERFNEFLKRVMLHAAPLRSPEDVAWFLASYARDAKARIEEKAQAEGGEIAALANVRKALEQALGIRFEGSKGDHFFRSTLVQTLFYGVFSAWVLWSKKHPPSDTTARFNWHEAAWSLHVPMIRTLYEEVAKPSKLGPLGLVEVLDWTGGVLNRVDRASFFAKFEAEQAVQYFYEPFLQAFDPTLRKDLGVWYTPTEVVRYMVARVDTALREELGIADGLADPRVVVLDPCCGTGAYLVEVVKRIAATMRDQGGDALIGDDLKQAAMSRVFGFEILPAPFVVAHLQLGLLLQNLDAPLSAESSERVGVYLTNALTGWEPPKGPKQRLISPEMEEERDAAERVKQSKPIIVVMGNPPYNGYPGVGVDEERDLSNAYRSATLVPAPQGRGLNDLFVRFYRIAERRIVEQTGSGVICFITNYSWLDGLSYTGMRERYLANFDQISIDCLNGDKYRTGKLTPSGAPDPSIFSTNWNREGIQVGTAIATLVRKERHEPCKLIKFRDFWGVGKIHQLEIAATSNDNARPFEDIEPSIKLGLPFFSLGSGSDYNEWPTIHQIIPLFFPGIQTARDTFLVDIDLELLKSRIYSYFDKNRGHEELGRLFPGIMRNTGRYIANDIRDKLLKRGILTDNFFRYCYRPFDIRWIYWEPETKLLDEKRSELFGQVFEGNRFLVTQQKPRREWSSAQVISHIADLVLMDRGASCFPLLRRKVAENRQQLFQQTEESGDLLGPNGTTYNLSENAAKYLHTINSTDKPDSLFYNCLAIFHSPKYAKDNSGALRQDWPHIPLSAEKSRLLQSAGLGHQIADLLDTDAVVPGITSSPIRSEIKTIAPISRVGGGSLSAERLALTVGWGHGGKGGITMPGKGRIVEREYTPEEREAIGSGAEALGMTLEECVGLLGETTRDIYLNEVAYWKNVPARVWEYTIGGYQVIKKWLSYRERPILGRALTKEEARLVTEMARRIAALILLGPALDANYASVKQDTYPWPTSHSRPGGSG